MTLRNSYVTVPRDCVDRLAGHDSLAEFGFLQVGSNESHATYSWRGTDWPICLIAQVCGRSFERLFENSYFCFDDDGLAEGASLYFGLSRSDYSHVDSQRNLGCLNHLEASVNPEVWLLKLPVLDFGAGSGWAARELEGRGRRVICFDSCKAMRDGWGKLGLQWVENLALLQSESIGVVFACYVLHYGLSSHDANSILRVLGRGGVLVGNVHKSIGLDRLSARLSSIGLDVQVEKAGAGAGFGSILCARKIA